MTTLFLFRLLLSTDTLFDHRDHWSRTQSLSFALPLEISLADNKKGKL